MNISTARMIEASIDILNNEGINGLTMRKLADKLHVAAPSFYFHIKDKLTLYGLITEYICGLILRQITPQDSLQDICLIVRKEYKAIRHSPQLVAISPPRTPDRIALINIFFDKLRALGVAEEYLAVSGNLLNNYILSFVADEEIWEAYRESAIDLPFAAGVSDADTQFAFGLRIILNGLEASK